MREHEIGCFERCFRVEEGQIEIFDLLSGAPSARELDAVDVVLLGGSGDYSVAQGGPWLQAALDSMVALHETSKPTFASCWGFQAMARAMGGEVVTDRSRAEVGATWMELTSEGETDPVFGPLEPRFRALSGHEDIVTALPPTATLLASSETVENQAFCFPGKPIYCTQFHPELTRDTLLDRLRRYPKYLEEHTGLTYDEFVRTRVMESPTVGSILTRFVEEVLA